MNNTLFDLIQNQCFCSVAETPTNNEAEQFIVSYYYYLTEFIIRENNTDKSNINKNYDEYSIRTKFFLDWFQQEGKTLFIIILKNLDDSKLDENAIAFSKLYLYLLNRATSNSNLDSLIDYLYLIPDVMKREYEKFGFLRNVFNIDKSIPIAENLNKTADYRFNIMGFERSENQVSCFI